MEKSETGLGWGYVVSTEPAIFLYLLLPGLVECMKIKLYICQGLLGSQMYGQFSESVSLHALTILFLTETMCLPLLPLPASHPVLSNHLSCVLASPNHSTCTLKNPPSPALMEENWRFLDKACDSQSSWPESCLPLLHVSCLLLPH